MRIIKRLAEERYCYMEVSFDSLEEYEKGYPEFVKSYMKVKKEVKKIQITEVPFEGTEYTQPSILETKKVKGKKVLIKK